MDTQTEMTYAGLWRRFGALVVALLLFCAVFFPVTRLVDGWRPRDSKQRKNT